MTKEQKAKWIEALRSGDYKQGQGALREDDRFCCLGLACEILNNSTMDYYFIKYKMLNNDVATTLIKMNDFDNKSFKQIADYIEENIHAS